MKKIFALILALVLCFSIAGCGKAPEEETVSTEPAESIAPQETPAESEKAEPEEEPETEPAAEAEAPENTVPVNIYVGNSNVDGFDVQETMIPELNETELINALKNAGVLEEGVEALSFSQDGSSLSLDMNDAYGAMLQNTGTAGEYITLGAVVNTFLTAYSASEISITVNGEVIATGHDIYDIPFTFYENC